MANKGHDILWPADTEVLVRVAILHVGQGASALVFMADGETYRTLLVDINLDSKAEGIDVPTLVADVIDKDGLGVFVNTHPHSDHLCGVTELGDTVAIGEVWHSGHIPGPDDRAAYDNLQKLIKKVLDAGGAEMEMRGSDESTTIGEAECHILAPADYVKDEIGDETPENRRKRIHEQSAVLKFGDGEQWIMIPGDADRDAWELHITKHHGDRIGANVLAAAHHGSRSYFKHEEEDEPYLDALQGTAPTYIIVSAPRVEESRHDHPHPDAMELYEDEVGKENLFHTGEDRHSYICDIRRDGTVCVVSDDGELAEAYPYPSGDGGDGKKSSALGSSGPAILRNDGRSA